MPSMDGKGSHIEEILTPFKWNGNFEIKLRAVENLLVESTFRQLHANDVAKG